MYRLFAILLLATCTNFAAPLRVFIRGGEKNRGTEVHAHPRFLAEWKTLLAERGMTVDGSTDWPNAEQASRTDVIVAYAQDGGNATPEQEKIIEAFVKRGGGLVVIHTAAVSFTNPGWWRETIGGAWVAKQTKWKEGPMDLYYTENQYLDGGHPITRGAANFHLDDEIYYDMDVKPEARVLAASYTPNVKAGKKQAEGGKAHVYDIQPQMWAYETAGYRAFVTIPGHQYKTFSLPQYRAVLLRGMAWAGKRANLDEYVKKEELDALTYPPGGPQKPADTLSSLEVHPDFTMKLVAAEPLINKPMNFDWDPAGRLWVAETPEYPNGRRGMRPDYRGKEWKDHGGIDPTPGVQDRKAQDRISILIDSDGDGTMDRKQVFADGLDLVTGFVFHRDGVIATQAPDILFLRDTDGDGKADKTEKLYTGLGIRDTHAVINNPRWGWDGWIYATHGYSSSSDVKNAKGETQGTIGSGVVRFRPDGSKIEQYSSKGGNTWGLAITGDNRVMWTQPTSGQLLMQTVLPEYALARGKIGNTTSYKVVEPSPKSFPLMTWEQLAYVQIDWVGSFTAAAGCAIYDGGTWPAEYNGDYFTTEPTINVIHHTRLTPDGSSYKATKTAGREETEFVRSRDMWWRPIETRVGPDGALYVADFYNQAVIHNDTRGADHNGVNAAVRPDRDHYFGRIWRIDHKKAKALPVPDLATASVAGLVRALESPNRAVRMTASRLLVERKSDAANIPTESRQAEVEIAAMWTKHRLGRQDASLLTERLKHPDGSVRRNAALVIEDAAVSWNGEGEAPRPPGVVSLLADPDGQVRLAALRVLAAAKLADDDASFIATAWPARFEDDYQRSAAIGAASQNPVAAIGAALERGDAARSEFVSQLAEIVDERGDSTIAAKLVIDVAAKPNAAAELKRVLLEALGRSLKIAPELSPELSVALGKLLDSNASSAALPLAAQWDKSGELKAKVTELSAKLKAQLADPKADDATRLAAAQSLIGIRNTGAEILRSVVAELDAEGDPAFKRQLILALADVDDRSVGMALVGAFHKLPADARATAFDTLLKRADWSSSFLDAIEARKVDFATLGPASAFRLRTHADKNVADRAARLFDDLNPMAKAKKEAMTKLMPLVEQKGDVVKGKAAFTTACAICHEFGGVGAKIGPGLTGMGSHGASELLGAVVDPNAEVDPSFVTWNIETKGGQFFAGIIEAENPTTITLKSLAGVQQVKVADIKKRENTGRSLMPEGFEGLGGEQLRDIIAYMQSVDGGRFRTLDLREAFTASTTTGLYHRQEQRSDSFEFAKTGTVKIGEVPFNIVGPDRASRNIVVLKGGPDRSYSDSLPQKVEVKAGGFKANRLHFLGGVAGWGWRRGSDNSEVLKVTIHTTQGQREGMSFRNGIEFADYNAIIDVPGSKLAEGLVKQNHQLRWFSRQLALGAVEIDRITIESLDNRFAPTLVAITAELADEKSGAPQAPSTEPGAPNASVPDEDAGFSPQFTDPVPRPPVKANGPRVLLVGGGSSHDFVKFFGESDKAILAPHVGWIEFTQNANGVAPILKDIDVLVWSANQPISSATRKALMSFVNAGKSVLAYHPGTWYAWRNFPEWNAQVVGGGARGHDKLGEFQVNVTHPAHPIMAGVPASFRITDELYHYQSDAAAVPIEVLATATSTQKPGTYPQAFVVKHPKARIVGITLGHDARAHDHPAFQTLLRNAVKWLSQKP